MRDPSIHIKESDLARVLYRIFNIEGSPISWDHKKMAAKIIEDAKSFSLSSRSITVTNEKVYKKAEKVQLGTRSNAYVFAHTLTLVRRKLKHRGVQMIRIDDKDWLHIKEISSKADEFCKEFNLDTKKGYEQYVTIGLSMMVNYSLYKFKSIHGPIINKYEAIDLIQCDRNSDATSRAHLTYLKIVGERIGDVQGYEKVPEKYKYFVLVAAEAKKYGISVKDYIQSQFAAFEWRNAVPDPAQMVGEKAVQRLQQYAYANGFKLGNRSAVIDFKRIKNGKGN